MRLNLNRKISAVLTNKGSKTKERSIVKNNRKSDEERSRIRRRVDWIGERLKIQTQSDWYKVKVEDFRKHPGAIEVLNNFSSSMSLCLKTVYQEYEWRGFFFTQTPKNYWRRRKESREFMDWIAEECGIEQQEDWYSVSKGYLSELGGTRLLLLHRSSLFNTLQFCYPEFDWCKDTFEKEQAEVRVSAKYCLPY